MKIPEKSEMNDIATYKMANGTSLVDTEYKENLRYSDLIQHGDTVQHEIVLSTETFDWHENGDLC